MVLFKSALISFIVFGLSACASFTKAREGNLVLAQKAHTRAELVDAFGESLRRRKLRVMLSFGITRFIPMIL